MNIQRTIMRDQNGTEGLLDLIKELPSKSSMIEIGTFTGESTVIFGDHFEKVIGVDPMLPDYDPIDATSKFNFNEVLDMFKDRTKEYNNISLVQKTSDDAVNDFKDGSFDFVYIDGIHTYDGVKSDIINYLPKVKKGGVIGGHDYTNQLEHLVGVYEAVNEMFGKPDKVFRDNSWIKYI
jgi:predicted O-methyltransferase YrrM